MSGDFLSIVFLQLPSSNLGVWGGLMYFLMFTPSPSLFPQTCWIILCGPHQLPLGDHLQVLSLQQSCLRPFCVLFAAAPVQEDVEGHDKQDPQEKLHQLLGAGAAEPERPAAQRVRSLVGHAESEICPTTPPGPPLAALLCCPAFGRQLWAGWSPDHVPPVAQGASRLLWIISSLWLEERYWSVVLQAP